MRTFTMATSRTRTDKFWVDAPASHVTLTLMPKPASVEVWLNGERMTGLNRTDINGSDIDLGPLREGDTVIVCYEALRR